MKRAGIIAMVMVAVMLGAATDGFARYNRGSNQVRQNKRPQSNKVVSVDVGNSTITVKEGNEANAYVVNQFTTILVNGAPGKIADIKPGMDCTVTASSSGKNASRVEASGTGTTAADHHKGKKK
jgi:hypothetical protein